MGELGLDGRLRPVRGVLPATASAAGAGFTTVAVPRMNAPEAALMPGIRVLAVPSLAALLAHLRGERCPAGSEPVEVIEGGTFPGSSHWVASPDAGRGDRSGGGPAEPEPAGRKAGGTGAGRRRRQSARSRKPGRYQGSACQPGHVKGPDGPRPRRRARPASRTAGSRDLRGRRASPVHARAARGGQDDARGAASDCPSPLWTWRPRWR